MNLSDLRVCVEHEIKIQKQKLGKQWTDQVLQIPMYPVVAMFRRENQRDVRAMYWLGVAATPTNIEEYKAKQFLEQGVLLNADRGSRQDRCFPKLDAAAQVALDSQRGLGFREMRILNFTYLDEAQAKKCFREYLVDWSRDDKTPPIGDVPYPGPTVTKLRSPRGSLFRGY